MTEVNKSFHFYIRVSAEFLLLSGIWCVNNVVLRAIIRSGLLLDNLPNSVNFCVFQMGRTLREQITGWICLPPFHSPLLSSWPPLSPSSFFSPLYNSVNISEWSSCGVHIRK